MYQAIVVWRAFNILTELCDLTVWLIWQECYSEEGDNLSVIIFLFVIGRSYTF